MYWVFLVSLLNSKRLPRDRLEEIIDDVTSKYGVDYSDISHSIIRSKATRSNNIIVTRMQDGHISSMAKSMIGV